MSAANSFAGLRARRALIIDFDEGGYSIAVSSGGGITITFQEQACCNEQRGPKLGTFPQSSTIPGNPYTLVTNGYGGDKTGAILLSPFLKPGTVLNTFFR